MSGLEFPQHAAFPNLGDLFEGRYRILEAIGKGGFAQVYRARQEDLDRDVAIKILTPGSDNGEPKYADVLIQRFHQEARLVSKLKDPHTITMYDYGQSRGGLLYLVLEFVQGVSLSQLIKSEAPIAPERVFRIIGQTLLSLREAHELGVLHRDIKPANIMLYEHLGTRDHVKLLDFGIAKVYDEARGTVHDLTADGVLLGTANYMSPEQILGRKMTPASDLYSLGLVAYELVVGRRANDEPSTMDIIGRQIDPVPFTLPDTISIHLGLRRFINRMVAKPLEERYQSAEEAFLDLERLREEGDRTVLAHAGAHPTPPSPDEEEETLAFDGRKESEERHSAEFIADDELPELIVEDEPIDVLEHALPAEDPADLEPTLIRDSPYRSKPFVLSGANEEGTAEEVRSVRGQSGMRPVLITLAVVAGVAGVAGVALVAGHWLKGSQESDRDPQAGVIEVATGAEVRPSPEANPTLADEKPLPSSVLEITTAPPGLSVYIDDKLAGLSPVEIDLHGFTFPATISARLHADATRTVVLTRPAPFVHLDFTHMTGTSAPGVETPPAATPEPTPQPVMDSRSEVVAPKLPQPEPVKTAAQPRPAQSPRPAQTPRPAPAERKPDSSPDPAPVKPAEPAPSSGFNLPALDNLE